MTKVKWASYGDWSGPSIHGVIGYAPPAHDFTEWDVVEAAVAGPEGGTYDGVTMYDGTAVTFGLFQWTLTSGRLQKLLHSIAYIHPHVYAATLAPLFEELGLIVVADQKTESMLICDAAGAKLSKDGLRNVFTPPGGKVPAAGRNWETAKKVALAWNSLATNSDGEVQDVFAMNELVDETAPGRPAMGGMSIANVLYQKQPAATMGGRVVDVFTPARALFWSIWQNNPRHAEQVLVGVHRVVRLVDNPARFTHLLSRNVANSNFGNWGVKKAALCKKCGTQNLPLATRCKKCKAPLRESRYSKIVTTVNRLVPNSLEVLP